MAEKPTEDVIPLSRFRAALARARRGRRADALAADSDGPELVRRLPVQELYYAIRELGLSDAEQLLLMATPEQVQGLVGIDGWQREHFAEDPFSHWLAGLVAVGRAPPA